MTKTTERTIGRYRLLEEVGQGGMSVVYRAVELGQDRVVAMKVLSPFVAQEPRFKARFDREVRLLHLMDHPNIVPILNYGEELGQTYIVMPYYGGGTMQDLIEEGGMDLRQLGELLSDISAGLDYAHREQIVHRDIKPPNVLLNDEGTALISDFGFAHVSSTSHSLTGSVLIGTPAFMSPEQCAGSEVDARSDQYSLGAVLYQAATGRLPYEGESPMAVVLKHINEPLTRPRYVNPGLPDAVESVILQAMEKDPIERFGSTLELNSAFQAALDEALDSETGQPKTGAIGPVPATQVIGGSAKPSIWRSRPALAALGVLLAFALPAAALALRGDAAGAAGAGSDTATPSEFLLATIDALSTANAEQLSGSQEPGAVETAVAATVEAMGLFDQPTATLAVSASPTPTPTRTPTATATFKPGPSGDSGNSPTEPPSDSEPPATSTPTGAAPSDTPAGPTSTSPPTITPVPPTPTDPPEPTIKPNQCQSTEGLPHYCTPVP